MTTIEFPNNGLKFREKYPCFNNVETRIDLLKRESAYYEQTRSQHINCETKAPYDLVMEN